MEAGPIGLSRSPQRSSLTVGVATETRESRIAGLEAASKGTLQDTTENEIAEKIKSRVRWRIF